MRIIRETTWSLGLILLVVIGASLPMAWISLAKLSLFAYAVITIILWSKYSLRWQTISRLWSLRLIGLGVGVSGFSMLWSIAPIDHAFHAWIKHAKLLIIPFLLLIIYDEKRARLAMRWFVLAQGFVILLSWLIALGLPIASNSTPELGPVVFAESYIDQSAMFSISGALAWHFRNDGLWPRWLSFAMPVLATINVLLLLPGRSGYLIILALICAAIFWELPARFRYWTTMVIALILIIGCGLFSPQFRAGIERAYNESTSFIGQPETKTSSGWRLNAWHRSLQAIAEKPLTGYGVGSFVPAVKAFETEAKDSVFGTGLSSNPHQEFLLWGVETGLGGIFILSLIFSLIAKSALTMQAPAQRATMSVVLAICIACIFNSALYDDLIGDFLCIALSVCMAYGFASSTGLNGKKVILDSNVA